MVLEDNQKTHQQWMFLERIFSSFKVLLNQKKPIY
jgi:hypothetical protein